MSGTIAKLARVFWLMPGFLLWASFPPMGEKTDVVFALAPLVWLSRRADVKTSMRRWFANGFLFWFATLSWMPAIVKNGGPWPLVALGWAALSAYCALYFAAYGWLSAGFWAFAKTRGYAVRLATIFVAEPVLWCGLELLRSRLFGGFAWNQLGVAAVNAGFGSPAAFGGVYLCSATVFLINGAIASIAERMWKWDESGGWPRWSRPIETMLPVAIAVAVHWCSTRPLPEAKGETRVVKTALLQRNFPCVFREREEHPETVYRKLAENVAPYRPDLVVLSESALCEFGAVESLASRRFASELLERTGARGVLAGGSRSEDGREYNSAVLYGAGAFEVYDKVHLVPFGEYIPGDKLFPALQKFAPVGSCTPGELKCLDFGGVRLGVAICYEDTDSAQMRRLAEKGADMFVFITNDSWFSRSVEAEQHAWQAVARAVETGRGIVRVGNSGVSGTVSPAGAATWIMDGARPLVDAKATMFDALELPPAESEPRQTVYTRLGDKPLFCAFLLLIAGAFLLKYKTNHEKRRQLSM